MCVFTRLVCRQPSSLSSRLFGGSSSNSIDSSREASEPASSWSYCFSTSGFSVLAHLPRSFFNPTVIVRASLLPRFCAVFSCFVSREKEDIARVLFYLFYPVEEIHIKKRTVSHTRPTFSPNCIQQAALGSSPMWQGAFESLRTFDVRLPAPTVCLLGKLRHLELGSVVAGYISPSNRPVRLQCLFNLSTSRVSCRVTLLLLALASFNPLLSHPLNGIIGPTTCWLIQIIHKPFKLQWLLSKEATISINFILSQCRLLGFLMVHGSNHHGVRGYNHILSRRVSSNKSRPNSLVLLPKCYMVRFKWIFLEWICVQ